MPAKKRPSPLPWQFTRFDLGCLPDLHACCFYRCGCEDSVQDACKKECSRCLLTCKLCSWPMAFSGKGIYIWALYPQQCHNTVLWRVGVGAAESLSQAGIFSARHRRWEVVRIYEICWRGGWQTGDILGILYHLATRTCQLFYAVTALRWKAIQFLWRAKVARKRWHVWWLSALPAFFLLNLLLFPHASIFLLTEIRAVFVSESHRIDVQLTPMQWIKIGLLHVGISFRILCLHLVQVAQADAADHTCVCLDHFEPDMISAFRRFSILKNRSGVEGGHALGLPYAWSGTRVPLLYATLKRGWEPEGVVAERFLKLRSHLEQKRLFAIG